MREKGGGAKDGYETSIHMAVAPTMIRQKMEKNKSKRGLPQERRPKGDPTGHQRRHREVASRLGRAEKEKSGPSRAGLGCVLCFLPR